MNKFVVVGRYSDGSGDSEFAFSANDEIEALAIAAFLNEGDYMYMQWKVIPTRWLSVPSEYRQ